MKAEQKKQIKEMRDKVNKLYNGITCIVGNIDNDNYLQLVPELKILHKRKDKSICSAYINSSTKIQELSHCPECKDKYFEV